MQSLSLDFTCLTGHDCKFFTDDLIEIRAYRGIHCLSALSHCRGSNPCEFLPSLYSHWVLVVVGSDLSAAFKMWPSSGRSPVLEADVDWLISFLRQGFPWFSLVGLDFVSFPSFTFILTEVIGGGPTPGIRSLVGKSVRNSVLYTTGPISRGIFGLVQVWGVFS